jgi:hypothetical protein
VCARSGTTRHGVDGIEKIVAVEAAENGISVADGYTSDGRRLSCADCGGVNHPAHCNAAVDLGNCALVSRYGTVTPRGCRCGVDEADISLQETKSMSVCLIQDDMPQGKLTRQITSCRLVSQQLYTANMRNRVGDCRELTCEQCREGMWLINLRLRSPSKHSQNRRNRSTNCFGTSRRSTNLAQLVRNV